MGEAIAICGLGAVCSVGANTDELRASLRAGRPGLRPMSRVAIDGLAARPVGEVLALPGRPEDGTATHRLAVAAAREAVRALPPAPPERVAVVFGTTTGGIGGSERWYLAHLAGRAEPTDALRRHAASTVSHAVADAVGAAGPRLTLSTACSSGANALLLGADMLRAGDVDRVVAGGADSLTWITVAGFSSLRLMADSPCRPFGVDRAGLNLGEAGAALVLERGSDLRARGGRALAWLAGAGCTCDAHHMTAPAPDGARVVAAIRDALRAADLDSSDIDYVNAHGTATPTNDIAEARALRQVFGSDMPPVSASKSFLGHTLGAAGAIEAVISVLTLHDGVLPATLNTREPDPEAPPDLVLEPGRRADPAAVLSTSFAFGGNNAALVLTKGAP